MTKFLVLTEDDSTGQCIRMWEPKKGESLELLSQDETHISPRDESTLWFVSTGLELPISCIQVVDLVDYDSDNWPIAYSRLTIEAHAHIKKQAREYVAKIIELNRDVNDYIYLMEASSTGFVEEFEVTV